MRYRAAHVHGRCARALSLAAVTYLSATPALHAATRTFLPSAAGTYSWGTFANWVGNLPPSAGDDVLVAPAPAGPFILNPTVSYSAGTRLGNVTLSSSTPNPVTFNLTSSPVDFYSTNLTLADAGNAYYAQSTGVTSVSNTFYFGASHPGAGTYSLSNAGVLSVSSEELGYNGGGYFTQSGGTHFVTNLTIGRNEGSQGSYALSAGQLTVINEVIGVGGGAYFYQTGGAHTYTNMTVNANNGIDAGYVLAAAGVLNGTSLQVGGVGASFGYFDQEGGTHTVSNLNISAGEDTSAMYRIYGGSLVAGTITVGINSTFAQIDDGAFSYKTFNQTGGEVRQNGARIPAGSTYNLSGGLFKPGGIVTDGDASRFHWTGGTLSLNVVNLAPTDPAFGSSLTIDRPAMTLVTSIITVGDGGPGQLTVSDGVVGGTFLTIKDTPGSSITLSGGAMTVTAVNFNAHPERFVWTGGTLTLGNGYTVDAYFTPTGTLSLSHGMVLRSDHESTNNGTITLVGGTSLAGNGWLTNNGTVSGNGGSIDCPLYNVGTLAVQPGGTLLASILSNATGGTVTLPLGSTLSASQSLYANAGTIIFNGGTLNNNLPATFTNTGTITGRGTLTGVPVLLNNGFVSVTLGALSFTGAVTGAGSITVGSSASFSAPGGITQSLLTNRGTVSVGANSKIGTLDFPEPAAGTLDIANRTLTLTSTTPAALRGFLFNHQLFSSTADADPQHRLTLGYRTTAGTTLVKQTFAGDANLDGKINADDYVLLDRGFAQNASTWQSGDFNYDGTTTSADYLLIDKSLAQQGGTLTPSFLAQRESQFGDAYVTTLLAAIPEPTSPFACGLAILALFPRRRRHPNNP